MERRSFLGLAGLLGLAPLIPKIDLGAELSPEINTVTEPTPPLEINADEITISCVEGISIEVTEKENVIKGKGILIDFGYDNLSLARYLESCVNEKISWEIRYKDTSSMSLLVENPVLRINGNPNHEFKVISISQSQDYADISSIEGGYHQYIPTRQNVTIIAKRL